MERLYTSPTYGMWYSIDEKSLSSNLPPMVVFPETSEFYNKWQKDLESRGVKVSSGSETITHIAATDISRSDSTQSSMLSSSERQMCESFYVAAEIKKTITILMTRITIFLKPRRSLTRLYSVCWPILPSDFSARVPGAWRSGFWATRNGATMSLLPTL